MTAHELVAAVLRRIRSYQKQTRSVAATEVYTDRAAKRRVDIVEVHCSWAKPRIVFYEVKSCRRDFTSDSKWVDYLPYCHQFWFVFPAGAITARDLDDPKIGLMSAHDGALRVVRRAGIKEPTKPDGDLLRYMLWKHQTQPLVFPLEKHGTADAIRYWAKNRHLNHELSREFNPAILDEISALKHKIYRLEHRRGSDESLEPLRELLIEKNVINAFDRVPEIVEAMKSIMDQKLPDNMVLDLKTIKRIVGRYVD